MYDILLCNVLSRSNIITKNYVLLSQSGLRTLAVPFSTNLVNFHASCLNRICMLLANLNL